MLTLLLYVMPWVVVIACLALWMQGFERMRVGQSLLPLAPRRPVPWTLLDLLVAGFIGILVLVLMQVVLSLLMDLPEGSWELNDLTPNQRLVVLVSFSASSLLGWLVAIGICRFRAGASWRDLGVVKESWQSDVLLGTAAFAMLVVPMLLIHFLASLVLAPKEGHPFVEIIKDDPRVIYLAPIAFAAVVVAPLVEETVFRLLLQGWLERVVARYEASLGGEPFKPEDTAPTGCDQASERMADAPRTTQPAASTQPQLPGDDDVSPEQSPHVLSADGCLEQGRQEDAGPPCQLAETFALPRKAVWRALPIAVSALMFAGAHLGQGAAPIGLFFLALGLGYLYQRTHRILPCIVVHVLVNLTAVLQLIYAVLNGTV